MELLMSWILGNILKLIDDLRILAN